MPRYTPHVRLLVSAAIVGLSLSGVSMKVSADEERDSASGKSQAAVIQARHRAVKDACVAELADYCPNSSDLSDGIICLKPYALDLSLKCRSALRAALQTRHSQ